MNVTFTGKIIAAEPVRQGTSQQGTQWCSQTYVIEELNQQYPSRAVFQVFGSDRLQQFAIKLGEVITVHIGFKASQSSKDGRWFNQLDCWKVDRYGAQQPTQLQGQVYQSQVNQAPQQNFQQPMPQHSNPQTQPGTSQQPDSLPF